MPHREFTTLRQAILWHAGEAEASADAFRNLDDDEQDSIVEFLKTLQVLPPGVEARVVDENHKPRRKPFEGG